MVFLIINTYVNNYGDEHKIVFRPITDETGDCLEMDHRRDQKWGVNVSEFGVNLWMGARLLFVNKCQCLSVCYCLKCSFCL